MYIVYNLFQQYAKNINTTNKPQFEKLLVDLIKLNNLNNKSTFSMMLNNLDLDNDGILIKLTLQHYNYTETYKLVDIVSELPNGPMTESVFIIHGLKSNLGTKNTTVIAIAIANPNIKIFKNTTYMQKVTELDSKEMTDISIELINVIEDIFNNKQFLNLKSDTVTIAKINSPDDIHIHSVMVKLFEELSQPSLNTVLINMLSYAFILYIYILYYYFRFYGENLNTADKQKGETFLKTLSTIPNINNNITFKDIMMNITNHRILQIVNLLKIKSIFTNNPKLY
jgi:hypothetical protein